MNIGRLLSAPLAALLAVLAGVVIAHAASASPSQSPSGAPNTTQVCSHAGSGTSTSQGNIHLTGHAERP